MTTIRASACRQFVVVQIGEAAPHVLSLDDAEAVAKSYQDDERNWTQLGRPAVAAMAGAFARQLLTSVQVARGR